VDYEQLILSFTSIVYEALPFIVLGVLIAGLLEEFVPQQAIARVFGNPTVLLAAGLGLLALTGGAALAFRFPSFWQVTDVPSFIRISNALASLTALQAAVLLFALLVEIGRSYFGAALSGKLILGLGIGCVLGLVFPMCECGIIVVMKRLLRKGLPLSVCVAYMLAGPVINVIVMTSTYVAFNPPDARDYILGGPQFVVAWRVGLSYLVALVTALIVEWQARTHGNKLLHSSVTHGLMEPEAAAEERELTQRTWGDSVNNITQTALHDFIDIMAFLILGAMLAVGGKLLLRQGNFQEFVQDTPAVAILMMMLIAVLFCLCSEADAFVAANFPLFWPPASKLAFLVLGPMLDLKLALMYTRVYRPRLILTIISSVVIQVFVYTMLVHYLVPSFEGTASYLWLYQLFFPAPVGS
jgi:uncharacterized membrane protein YraQ (UPF0718 family)